VLIWLYAGLSLSSARPFGLKNLRGKLGLTLSMNCSMRGNTRGIATLGLFMIGQSVIFVLNRSCCGNGSVTQFCDVLRFLGRRFGGDVVFDVAGVFLDVLGCPGVAAWLGGVE
jgi:hypothetical protein